MYKTIDISTDTGLQDLNEHYKGGWIYMSSVAQYVSAGGNAFTIAGKVFVNIYLEKK